MTGKAIVIGTKSRDWRGKELSHRSISLFSLGDAHCYSYDGFIQGIKFPPGDPRRKQAFNSEGVEARKIGKQAGREYVWWKGRRIPYRSAQHLALEERAMRMRFSNDHDAQKALLATIGHRLTYHKSERPNSALRRRRFLALLVRLREELARTGRIKAA